MDNKDRKLNDAYAATLQTVAAEKARAQGVTRTANELHVSRSFVRYWTEKKANHSFHSGKRGGPRRSAFTDTERALAERTLIAAVRWNPMQSSIQFRNCLFQVGISVSIDWVKRALVRCGLTWKRAQYKQINKFTAANINYTLHYLLTATALPHRILKFLDESHFNSRDLRRERGVSERGRPLILVSNQSISESYSVTAVTSLSDPLHPVVVPDVRTGSNSAIDFLHAVFDLIHTTGTLSAGDVLILDNASVHTSIEIRAALSALLSAARVRLLFLPAYSPEYNPCELVFRSVKSHLRRKRGDKPFLHELLLAFSLVSFDNVVGFYSECLDDVLL